MSLGEILKKATKEHWAVPHFNFTTLSQLKAITQVCQNLRSPVILGTSEGERDFIGIDQALALVRSYKEEGMLVFLNADHTRSVERAKEAIDAGYESVHIDLSEETYEKNLKGTKEVVSYARGKDHYVFIEGELGYLPTRSSKIYKEEIKIDPESLTKPDEAQRFVAQTNIDRFAPAVGSLHGIAANKPHLDFGLIKKIRSVIPKEIPLVLHGGSGIDNASFKKAIELGFANIHISTEIRKAWKESLAKALEENVDVYAPYRILAGPVERIKAVIEEKIDVFGSAQRY